MRRDPQDWGAVREIVHCVNWSRMRGDDAYNQYRGEALAFPNRKELNSHGPLKYQDMVYAIVRAMKPCLVFETGVRYGVCTTHVLAALNANRKGVLVSCDPMYDSQKLAEDTICELTKTDRDIFAHWLFMPGISRVRLPEMLREEPEPPDLFIHDSDHSWENMSWELEFMFNSMRGRGTIVCDDWDMVADKDRDRAAGGNVFERFAAKYDLNYNIIGTAAIASLNQEH